MNGSRIQALSRNGKMYKPTLAKITVMQVNAELNFFNDESAERIE